MEQVNIAQPLPQGNILRVPGGDENGSVQVRNMTESDSEFAAKMTIESFESKFIWAVGKSKLNGLKKAEEENLSRMRDVYPEIFIATVDGKPAGMLQLKFSTSVTVDTPLSNYSRYIGCCGTIGLCCMMCVLSESSIPKGTCYIDHICVDSSFRGKGVGTVLLERADFEARLRGCYRLQLYVAQSNRARNLYQRHGYRIIEDEDGCLITWCTVGIRHWYKMEKTL